MVDTARLADYWHVVYGLYFSPKLLSTKDVVVLHKSSTSLNTLDTFITRNCGQNVVSD